MVVKMFKCAICFFVSLMLISCGQLNRFPPIYGSICSNDINQVCGSVIRKSRIDTSKFDWLPMIEGNWLYKPTLPVENYADIHDTTQVSLTKIFLADKKRESFYELAPRSIDGVVRIKMEELTRYGRELCGSLFALSDSIECCCLLNFEFPCGVALVSKGEVRCYVKEEKNGDTVRWIPVEEKDAVVRCLGKYVQ